MNVTKEIKRLLQKHYRTMDTNYRKAMLRWRREKGAEARDRFMQTPRGQQLEERRKQARSKGGEYYEKVMEEFRRSREAARRGRLRWTCKEEQKLVYLVEAGLTNKMIAKIMDRSIKGISQKRIKMGISA